MSGPIMRKGMEAEDSDLDLASKPRSLYGSKFDNGRVLVVGGSERFHGAPVLASKAAFITLAVLRIGVGYVITCVPKSIVLAVRKLSANIIVVELSGDNVNMKDLPLLQDEASKADAILIGPGLGREEESRKTAAQLIKYCMKLGKKVVVDADSLRAIQILDNKLNKNVLITPNDKEFEQLFKKKPDQRDAEKRATAAGLAAKRLDANVLLKGHISVVSDGKSAKIIRARTATLATMGTGDVLAGIIAGFAARKSDMLTAAAAGTYLHTAIGDALYKEKGYHITAQDVVDFIPKILKHFDRTSG